MLNISKILLAILLSAASLTAAELAPAENKKAPPGDEVMQPTNMRVEITPQVARSMARFWMEMYWSYDLALTRKQKEDITRIMTEKFENHPYTRNEKGTLYLEYLLEAEFAYRPSFDAKTGKDFAQRYGWLPQTGIEFYGNICDEIRPLLNSYQQKRLDDWLADWNRTATRFDTKLKRWAKGKADQDEHPFRWKKSDKAGEKNDQPAKTGELKQALKNADWDVERIGPGHWQEFMARADDFFNFDSKQHDRAQQLLADYCQRAQPIMTPQWKKEVRKNLTLQYLVQDSRDKKNLRPWQYQLQRDYRALVKPLGDLGSAFREDILALVTPEQQKAVLQEMQNFAAERKLDLGGLEAADRKLTELRKKAELEHATDN